MTDAAAAGPRCRHCGLAVPPERRARDDETARFCCPGCEAVHHALRDWGLDRGYRAVRERSDADPVPARPSGRDYREFETPEVLEDVVHREGDRASAELFLDGVHCAACVWLIEKLPLHLSGVHAARLDLGRHVVELEWDAEQVGLAEIARTLDRFGYPSRPARWGEARARREADRRELVRLGVAGALAANLMGIAFALYGGEVSGMSVGFRSFFRWTSLALAFAVVFGPGAVFLRGAAAALRTRTAHMDLPIALGIVAGFLGGAWNTVRGGGEVYFESVGVLVFLLLAGRFLQRRQQRRAWDAVALLRALAPPLAHRLDDSGDTHDVPVSTLRPGDRIVVLGGETVPVDGVLREAGADFDQSLLTGESRPVRLEPGAEAAAGTTCLAGPAVVEVLRTGSDTRIGRMAETMERAARERPPSVQLADRLAGWFTVAVVAAAAATFAVVGRGYGLDEALDRAVALLVVACPCALGLATPLTLAAALGAAARRGILVRGGEALERLARPGTVFLDKTGTLTEGRFRLLSWTGDGEAARLAAALEDGVAGPYAAALRRLGEEGPEGSAGSGRDVTAPAKTSGPSVTERRFTPGAGVTGRVDGHEVMVGSARFLGERGITTEPFRKLARLGALATPQPTEGAGVANDSGAVRGQAEKSSQTPSQPSLASGGAHRAGPVSDDGATPVLVAVDGRLRGVARLGDRLRDGAAEAVAGLRGRGWRPHVLSGDHAPLVRAVAHGLGLDPDREAEGGLDPEAKVRRVRDGDFPAPRVMVGDGVNDAPALAAADVGIAVRTGAEVSLEAADVHLGDAGIQGLLDLLDGARRTRRVVVRGLLLSLAYNLAGVTLAAAGWIGPIEAAVLMPLSSLTVVTLAWRSRTFDPPGARPNR